MSEDRNYADFDLVVEHGEGSGYRAHIVDSPAGEATGEFTVPFSDLELENFLLRVGRPRRGTRRLESPEMEAARRFGAQLYEAVFRDDLRLTLHRSLDAVERNDEGLRIRLRLSDTPELASLPWEFLYNEDSDEFLVLSAWTPIVRYLDLTQQIDPLTVTGPLRILVMISGPEDYQTLDVEEEWNRIDSSLRPLIDRGLVSVTRTEEATLLDLQRRLRQDDDYHIFHYVGHGGYDEKSSDGVLVLEDGHNRSRTVAGRDLGTILQDHRSLRLAVLNACEGARASDTDPFSGVAQSLVRKGIPSVVAMQFEITDDAAIAFSSEFYAAIADGLPVDASIGEARRAIFGLGNDIEWGTPVVYLRGDGRLFDLDRVVPPPVVVPPVEPEPESEPETSQEVVAAAVVGAGAVETRSDAPPGGLPPHSRPWARKAGALPLWGWAMAALAAFIAVVVVGILLGGGEVEAGTVPDVVGMTPEAAVELIEADGFSMGNVRTETSDQIEEGTVMSQDPAAAQEADTGSQVNLVVSLGPPSPVVEPVPDVVGMAEEAARTRLETEGWVVGGSSVLPSESVPEGDVIAQDPAGDAEAEPGSTVDLIVSGGPSPPPPVAIVPRVVGKPVQVAVAEIEGEGLVVGEVGSANSDTVEQGNVITQDPAADEQVDPGSEVDLVVSAGPASVLVPEAIGKTSDIAVAEIEGEGLVIGGITPVPSEAFGAGIVIDQDPAAFVEVEPGSLVYLVVSSGPQEVGGQAITFEAFPGGVPLDAPVFLNGDEFSSLGVLFAGAPQSGYCAEATVTGIREAGTYGVPANFLTTTDPNQINRCNTVFLEITFLEPVQFVRLTFQGANVPYTISAWDSSGALNGVGEAPGSLGESTVASLASDGSNIRRVLFGSTTAITAVTEIYYER